MGLKLCNLLWRLLIGSVLLLAAWGKWWEGMHYGPPQTIYDRFVAMAPWRHYAMLALEAIVALWLISGWRTRAAAWVTGGMLGAFTLLLAAEIWRRTPALCGCGIAEIYPEGDPRVALAMGIVRNAILIFGCVWLILMPPHAESRAGPPDLRQG